MRNHRDASNVDNGVIRVFLATCIQEVEVITEWWKPARPEISLFSLSLFFSSPLSTPSFFTFISYWGEIKSVSHASQALYH